MWWLWEGDANTKLFHLVANGRRTNNFIAAIKHGEEVITDQGHKEYFLLSSVLDSLPTYFMSSFLLPKSIIKLIDKRRRAFFWAAGESCSGAQCLVAW
jgi:hypothetical protein